MKICENGIVREMTAEEEATLKALAEENANIEIPPTPEEEIALLKEQNEMLTACLMEMSEIVYA